MAFASSLSAFGMKPSTTKTTTPLFGQPQQPQQQQQQSNLFSGLGQSQQQTQPSTGVFGQQQGIKQPSTLSGQTQPGLFGSQPTQPSQQTTGSTQPQQAAGGLFGSTQSQPQQNTSNPLGSAQPQTAGGLFGQPQQQQTQPGSLFGGSSFGNAQPQQPQQAQPGSLFGGSSFGNSQPQQPQQAQPGSLFGGSSFGNSQPQQPQQAQPGSLFGGSIFGNPQPKPAQQAQPGSLLGGSVFGNPQPQQQQPQQTQPGSLFGGSVFGNPQPQPQQPQPAQPGSLFGGSLNQPQQPNPFGSTTTSTTNPLQPQSTLPASAFGSSTNTGTGPGTFGGGSTLFGNKPQQPQQQQSSIFGNAGQSADLPSLGPPPFTKSTKFNDLPDNVKSILENIDTHIQGRIQICKDLQQRKFGDEPTKGREAIRNIQKDLLNASTAIRNDLHLTQDLKVKVDQAVEDTIVATRIIDGFRHPQSGNTYLKDHAGFPLEYFTRITDQMKQRLDWYKSTIEQIERRLASASHSGQSPQSIAATLQTQHATFIALTSKTAVVDAELQKIKALYIQLWRANTGSVRDPFGDLVKSTDKDGDFGFTQLNVR